MSWDGNERRKSSRNNPSNEVILEAVLKVSDDVGAVKSKVEKFEDQVFNENTGIMTMVKKHDCAIYGNGKPGLIADVTNLRNDIDKVRTEGKFTWKQLALVGFMIVAFGSVLAFVVTSGIFVPHNISATTSQEYKDKKVREYSD